MVFDLVSVGLDCCLRVPSAGSSVVLATECCSVCAPSRTAATVGTAWTPIQVVFNASRSFDSGMWRGWDLEPQCPTYLA